MATSYAYFTTPTTTTTTPTTTPTTTTPTTRTHTIPVVFFFDDGTFSTPIPASITSHFKLINELYPSDEDNTDDLKDGAYHVDLPAFITYATFSFILEFAKLVDSSSEVNVEKLPSGANTWINSLPLGVIVEIIDAADYLQFSALYRAMLFHVARITNKLDDAIFDDSFALSRELTEDEYAYVRSKNLHVFGDTAVDSGTASVVSAPVDYPSVVLGSRANAEVVSMMTRLFKSDRYYNDFMLITKM